MNHIITLLLFCFLLFPQNIDAQSQIRLSVSEFDEDSSPDEEVANPRWTMLNLRADNLTDYSKQKDEYSNTVIKTESQNAASGLIYKINIDPKEYPVIEWRWRVDNIVEGGNVTRKDGDDYAARIYLTFIMTKPTWVLQTGLNTRS